ncbi:transglutaminase-like cysteine peptidase [Sphingobium aquiterrae]|uniref:transglutaminase-like cysteine peptidase n=1 Tax=Sphingobium aquiterrae TaxID=2038656 RepID=UPI003016E545
MSVGLAEMDGCIAAHFSARTQRRYRARSITGRARYRCATDVVIPAMPPPSHTGHGFGARRHPGQSRIEQGWAGQDWARQGRATCIGLCASRLAKDGIWAPEAASRAMPAPMLRGEGISAPRGQLRLMLLAILSIGGAQAGAISEQIPPGEAADPPVGFIEMCRRVPGLCAQGAPAAPATLQTPGHALMTESALWEMAQQVNRQVNRHVRRAMDGHHRNETDHWQRPPARHDPSGDCEDIAIEKRMQLLAAGMPARRMFYAIVYKSNLGLHTVLVVRFEHGDFVLDSITPWILHWRKTRYTWIRQQSPADPMRWARVPNH